MAPPAGSGVKAVPTICFGFAGLTVRCGTVSCALSSLIDFGIMSMRNTEPGPLVAFDPARRLEAGRRPRLALVFLAGMASPYRLGLRRRRVPEFVAASIMVRTPPG